MGYIDCEYAHMNEFHGVCIHDTYNLKYLFHLNKVNDKMFFLLV
jgi:hypothetical protein